MSALDTNHNVTARLNQLKTLGVDTVFRYISTNTGSEKCIKPDEASAIAAAGLKLGLVFEVYGGVDNFKHGDINAATGRDHATFARGWVMKVGAPPGAVVYFAIDTDATAVQIRDRVIPYFKSVYNIMSSAGFKTGAYGCGAMCKAVLDAGIADSTWLSNALGWNGSKSFRDGGLWDIFQKLPKTIAGLDTDPDELTAQPDVSPHRLVEVAFVPFAHKIQTPLGPAIVTTPHDTVKPTGPWQTNIVGTVFSDRNCAYGPITSNTLGVALPAHFNSPRPFVQVQNARTGALLRALVVERGPWYDNRVGWPNDPYWKDNRRPRAEADQRTNGAGIDLTPALAKAIGHNGKEPVNWRFVE